MPVETRNECTRYRPRKHSHLVTQVDIDPAPIIISAAIRLVAPGWWWGRGRGVAVGRGVSVALEGGVAEVAVAVAWGTVGT